LEGRLTVKDLENFRRELKEGGGLPSYPHPRLMKGYWQFPTVSMGLAPIMAIYQARFIQYIEDNKLRKSNGRKVWAFLGDGEMDEPEAMGAITLAAREYLDNLIFVVNCNLQRLDGPVRGNRKIIQELEAAFKGAGWNVIKVIWGSDWDPLLDADTSGLLVKRMDELLDGQAQKYVVSSGAHVREDFFGKYPELLELVENYSDEQISKLRRGGHDPVKVFNAFKQAVEHTGSPTIILAQTIKGYGLGEAGEGKNITHKQIELNEKELMEFRSRFNIPLSDDDVAEAPFYKPDEDSREIKYLKERREKLGGYLPTRNEEVEPIKMPEDKVFEEYLKGSGNRDVATTMVMVQIIGRLLKDKKVGELIVPIVPDEARTFGMESLFRQAGIYSHPGQNYEPVDRENLMYYKEATDGSILEEGITEAGSISSFIAAGTAYSIHRVNTIPFFLFYSMFGFQRIGDLIWAAGDARAKGFLVGGTAGRSSLPGEGLQHQDGQSHSYALAYPQVKAYDPAYAYELAVIVKNGIKRMYVDNEEIFYYVTIMNETYKMPDMPKKDTGPLDLEEGILRGIYRFRKGKGDKRIALLGSGTLLNEALAASDRLSEEYGISADVWSVTSYKELHYDALDADRHNRLHPGEKPKTPYIRECMEEYAETGVVAVTDYLKSVPLSVARWVPADFTALGTDGYGLSENRTSLRSYFEVDSRHITLAAVSAMERNGKVKEGTAEKAVKDLDIDPDKFNPLDR
ncbi:MAG: pyruvate dehydrogenase (acetyl-transferring), homodimeric type, partial [Spirochaetia bacterium]